MLTRRGLLNSGVALAGLAAPWRLWASPDGQLRTRLLLVFLRGAYDGLSALVPHAETDYFEARPNIAVRDSFRLDGRWGLHPALVSSLGPFWEAGQLAMIPFAGTDFVSRSHFQAQDWVEFGQPSGGSIDTSSGFLNRLLVQLGGQPQGAVSFTTTLPNILKSPVTVANARVPRGLVRSGESGSAGKGQLAFQDLAASMYAGQATEVLVREGLGLRREISLDLQSEMMAASRDALPPSGFAQEAARAARLMRERPQHSLGFVDIGGWDTHANQGNAVGLLANRLRELGEGLQALADVLGPREWARTVVVVISEFGRTFRENGARGTDHGHGTTLWVLGGPIRGGRILGDQAPISLDKLHQGRDLPVLNEYRSVLGGLVKRLYQLDLQSVAQIFPAARARDLGLI